MNKFQNLKFEDLEIIEVLAETHEGNTKIYLCRYEDQLIVCKAMSKEYLIKDTKAIEHAHNEKQILKKFTKMGNSHICSLLGVFQDQNHIYLNLSMAQGLPLHKLIHMMGPLSLRFTKIITTQVALIMKDFHDEGCIYRDIKSSNFMVNHEGKVTMIDLGKAKCINRERAYTICGTTHAMPPDIYNKKGYSYEFDYYSFGVLIYELLVGTAPFGYGNSNKNIRENVEDGLTEEILNKVQDLSARNLIKELMNPNPALRLGYQRSEEKQGFGLILSHQYFDSERELSRKVFNGECKLSAYDEDFSEYVSEIEDIGIDHDKYKKIEEDDPFFNFL